MADVHNAILNCETTGLTLAECRQDPDILNETNEIAEFYFNCMHWSPQQGYIFQMPNTPPVSADCSYWLDGQGIARTDCVLSGGDGAWLHRPAILSPHNPVLSVNYIIPWQLYIHRT
jgi:hypothetical protein